MVSLVKSNKKLKLKSKNDKGLNSFESIISNKVTNQNTSKVKNSFSNNEVNLDIKEKEDFRNEIKVKLIITNSDKINCESLKQKIMLNVIQIFGMIEASKLTLDVKFELDTDVKNNIYDIITNNKKIVSTSLLLLEDHIKPIILNT